MNIQTFTHLDEQGDVQMVDISDKSISHRIARAKGLIEMQPGTIKLIKAEKIPKGNVLTTAKLAAIGAAKQTFAAIPLCHQILLTAVEVQFNLTDRAIEAEVTVKCTGRTGAEMEALHAVGLCLLTIYDMCKAIDKNMIIKEIGLCSKSKTSV